MYTPTEIIFRFRSARICTAHFHILQRNIKEYYDSERRLPWPWSQNAFGYEGSLLGLFQQTVIYNKNNMTNYFWRSMICLKRGQLMFTSTPSVFVNETFYLHVSVKIHRRSENLHNSEFCSYHLYLRYAD